jgi:hypothetical protein
MVTLIALLLVAPVVGVLDLATASGLSAAGAIGGAAGSGSALVGVRSVTNSVDTWDAKHGQPGS